ncbi:hypothetical protein CDD83_10048 [Cordyceps sp. RAO-2017]|nr:hypothetical protein CDD83_10048 [Cordyceps sp. RAO-2017]
MKFTAAVVLAAAAGASAHYGGNATVVTEVVDVYTTYCPGPTQITHGSKTYTVTEATTLTITDCPCTITKPVMTTSAVVCHTCGGNGGNPVYPSAPANPGNPGNPGNGGNPGYNGTASATATVVPPGGTVIAPTGTVVPPAGSSPAGTHAPTAVPTAGAGKAAALSGAGLAGVVGLAAFLL